MIALARRQRLTEAMTGAGYDHLVLFGNAWQNDYLRYGADFGILEGEGVAVVHRDGTAELFLNHAFEAERAGVECPDAEVVFAPDLCGAVLAALEGLAGTKAAAPRRHLPHGLMRHRHALALADATPVLNGLLMFKMKEEQDAIRAAARVADAGYAVFLAAAREGRADYELIAEVEAFFRTQGVHDNFMLIGVGGPDVRGMAPPSGRELKRGDLVTTELSPCVDGYYAQICRTLVVGPPSEGQLKAFSVYDQALDAGIAAVRPGATASDVARAENDVFRAHGLGQYVTSDYTRVRGHGIGLFLDTPPHILEDVRTPLAEGMTLIVHPNTYHPEVGYFVHGDALIVGREGPEVLARTARTLFSNDNGAVS